MVLALCVNYRAPRDTQELVQDLLEQKTTEELAVWVIDNSPGTNGERLSLATDDERLRVLRAPENLGYFGGARWGLALYLQQAPLPDWVIVCNVDIRLPDREFVNKLASLAPNGPAVVAPSIRRVGTRLDQNPYLKARPTVARMQFYRWVFHYYPISLAYHLLARAKGLVVRVLSRGAGPSTEPTAERIYAPYGAVILFHRSYFEAGGTLHHGAFLFGEEIFVAETAARHGQQVQYEPGLRVVHHGHRTGGKIPTPKFARYMAEASRYLAEAYFD